MTCAVVLHGGAIGTGREDFAEELALLGDISVRAAERLNAGESSTVAVTAALMEMEASGLFIAGRGASPDASGRYALDASLMCGRDRRCGAVAGVERVKFPSELCARIAEKEREAFWIADGAEALARKHGCQMVQDPDAWFAPRFALEELGPAGFSTIGAAALDLAGDLTAGTSTGGLGGKIRGRVGDSPLIGAGTWADDRTAVSCTGDGQAFIRANAAALVGQRQALLGESLTESVLASLRQVAELGGSGGIIALSATGEVKAAHNAPGLKFAYVDGRGRCAAGAICTP